MCSRPQSSAEGTRATTTSSGAVGVTGAPSQVPCTVTVSKPAATRAPVITSWDGKRRVVVVTSSEPSANR
jgi:hypothetical protein